MCVSVAGRVTHLCCVDSNCQEKTLKALTALFHKLVFEILGSLLESSYLHSSKIRGQENTSIALLKERLVVFSKRSRRLIIPPDSWRRISACVGITWLWPCVYIRAGFFSKPSMPHGLGSTAVLKLGLMCLKPSALLSGDPCIGHLMDPLLL